MSQNINDTNMRLISISDACKRLGIGHWNVYQQINTGALKSVKIGKRRFIREGTLYEFIMSRER